MLACPRCHADLTPAPERVICASCGSSYPAPFGVPVLVLGAEVSVGHEPDEGVVAEVARAIGAEHAIADVRRCLSMRTKMPDPALQVEADQFVNRLRATGDVSAADQHRRDLGPVNVAADAKVALAPIILPTFVAGQRHTFNVRVTNTGRCALSSSGEAPCLLAYRWRNAAGLAIEGDRTALLVDMAPDRSLTVPMAVQAPPEAGAYLLELAPVIGAAWLDESVASLPVAVHASAPAPRFEHLTDRPALSYAEDHEYGARLLREWVKRFVPRDAPILEIGGNLYPLIAGVDHPERFNLDVDAPALMARNIAVRDSVVSVVGDGFNLPFRDGSLGAIVMTATFHHFPNPVGFLTSLRRKLRSDGLLALLCEPMGHVTVEHRKHFPLLFHELEAGVNEQAFEVWEYEAMARAAGYEIREARFEAGSAKIALQPRSPGNWLARRLAWFRA